MNKSKNTIKLKNDWPAFVFVEHKGNLKEYALIPRNKYNNLLKKCEEYESYLKNLKNSKNIDEGQVNDQKSAYNASSKILDNNVDCVLVEKRRFERILEDLEDFEDIKIFEARKNDQRITHEEFWKLVENE